MTSEWEAKSKQRSAVEEERKALEVEYKSQLRETDQEHCPASLKQSDEVFFRSLDFELVKTLSQTSRAEDVALIGTLYQIADMKRDVHLLGSEVADIDTSRKDVLSDIKPLAQQRKQVQKALHVKAAEYKRKKIEEQSPHSKEHYADLESLAAIGARVRNRSLELLKPRKDRNKAILVQGWQAYHNGMARADASLFRIRENDAKY